MKKILLISIFIFGVSTNIAFADTPKVSSNQAEDKQLPILRLPEINQDESDAIQNQPEENLPEKAKPIAESTVTVSNFKDFCEAVRNAQVTSITLTGNIDGTGSLEVIAPLTRDLTIDAQNFTLNIGNRIISLSNLDGQIHNFTLKNANIKNSKFGEGFIVAPLTGVGKWNVNFSNITATKDAINRVAQVQRCNVVFSGNNNIQTAYENLELGSFTLTKGSKYVGNVYGTDWALIDFTVGTSESETGGKRQFLIEDSASLEGTTTYNANGQSSWPAIWGYFKTITLGENSLLKIKWGNDVIRANTETAQASGTYPLGLTMLLKKNSVMDIDSVDDHSLPALNMDAGVNTITMEENATLKAKSDGAWGAMSYDGGTNKFYANKPKLVDFKNYNNAYEAFVVTVGAQTDFTIENTQVAYWLTDIDNDLAPTESFTNVGNINRKITNKWSSNPPEVAEKLNTVKPKRFATKFVETGSLSISEVPTKMGFGNDLKIPTTLTNFPLKDITGNLTVTDSRTTKQNWQLTVKLDQPLTGVNTKYVLDDKLYYKNDNADVMINDAATNILSHKNTQDDYVVSSNWGANEGFYLKIPAGDVKADSYAGKLSWDIRDVPV